jgi:integrase
MEITIYRRHIKRCSQKDDRYAPRCGCPLSGQFNWPQSTTKFDGKKLKHGQNKWSLNARTWSEAQQNATKLERDLEALIQGKPARKSLTVEAAVQEWLYFRSKIGLTNTKPKLMGDKLVDWCKNNDVAVLTGLTTERVMKFRTSLPFRTGDSSSLSVHWSVISGFFNWAVGMDYIEKTPILSGRQNKQFAIPFKKKEVVPPTQQEVEKVLATALGKVKILARLMRETGMALVDAQKVGMTPDDAQKFGLSKPERLPVLEDETLIRGNRTKTGERYRVRISQSLANQLKTLGSPAFPGTYVKWREELNTLLDKAGVKMTPHGFRHFRISEWLALGITPTDVSKMVGTSEKEIRKTYEHWIKEAEDRLDEIQRQSWLKQGLNENGDAKEQLIQ